MKKLFIIIISFISLQSLSAQLVHPNQDTSHEKKWNFGIYTGYQTDSRFYRNIELGLFAERKMIKNFGIETEFSLSINKLNQEAFNEPNETYPSLNFSLSGKLYFGKQKNWYTKAGFSFRKNVNESEINSSYGPVIALGRNLKIKNQNRIKLELNGYYDSYHGLISGVKLGYRF